MPVSGDHNKINAIALRRLDDFVRRDSLNGGYFQRSAKSVGPKSGNEGGYLVFDPIPMQLLIGEILAGGATRRARNGLRDMNHVEVSPCLMGHMQGVNQCPLRRGEKSIGARIFFAGSSESAAGWYSECMTSGFVRQDEVYPVGDSGFGRLGFLGGASVFPCNRFQSSDGEMVKMRGQHLARYAGNDFIDG